MLPLACTQPRTPRDAKKPRVQVVLLATDGDVAEPALAAKVAAGWKDEAARCQKPACELLKLAIRADPAHLAPFAYDAVLSKSPGPGAVATNVDGGVTRVTMERSGSAFEVLGMFTGQGGDDVTERAMQFVVVSGYKRGANATVVVSDDCAADLEKTTGLYGRQWPFLLAAVGRACDGPPRSKHVYATVVAGAADVQTGYTRLVLEFDKNTHALLSASTTFESWK